MFIVVSVIRSRVPLFLHTPITTKFIVPEQIWQRIDSQRTLESFIKNESMGLNLSDTIECRSVRIFDLFYRIVEYLKDEEKLVDGASSGGGQGGQAGGGGSTGMGIFGNVVRKSTAVNGGLGVSSSRVSVKSDDGNSVTTTTTTTTTMATNTMVTANVNDGEVGYQMLQNELSDWFNGLSRDENR
ncbi:hypothetical protein HDU76_009810, partial [Blyttiomyces sp. JEL0837]